jgi:3-hydroxyisobutyrate dehydrogenase-like beta-hydroxyacid dehydrogenase
MADNGQLIIVLAGKSSAMKKIHPAYTNQVMGRTVIDFPDQKPSQATLLKIHGNTFIFSMIETISEGLTLARQTGLGEENLHKYLEAMFPGPYVAYSNRMRSGDYYKRAEPLFQIDLARKDARHANDLAQKSGVKLGILEVVDRHFEIVKSVMGQRGDVAGLYGAVRKESGLEFENGEKSE